MTSDETDELRAFLLDHVSGFEELEALLFFVRAPGRVWSSTDVALSLRLPEEMVESALDALAAGGVVLERTTGSGGARVYRFIASEGTLQLLEKLRRAYDEERIIVMQIMTSNAMERVRSAAARRLADAFRLERGKK
ncbi:MAG TPA: hypothetical protein VHB79_04315 [Polyangiaceae bacterium]|nr:hypothetical protein [Polyangiaceae bacterium]